MEAYQEMLSQHPNLGRVAFSFDYGRAKTQNTDRKRKIVELTRG